jgi:hypothetical protein
MGGSPVKEALYRDDDCELQHPLLPRLLQPLRKLVEQSVVQFRILDGVNVAVIANKWFILLLFPVIDRKTF